MITIRSAKIKDLPEIVNMRAELSEYHEKFGNYFGMDKNAKKYITDLYKKYIHANDKMLLVAEANGKLIGFGSASIVKKEPVFKVRNFGHIPDMFIDKKFRRQGIAGKILKVFYKWFKEKNIKLVDLNVVYANKLGRNAWTKYGFKDYSIRKIKILK